MNYPTLILQKANTCLTGAVSDGRERVSMSSALWKKNTASWFKQAELEEEGVKKSLSEVIRLKHLGKAKKGKNMP